MCDEGVMWTGTLYVHWEQWCTDGDTVCVLNIPNKMQIGIPYVHHTTIADRDAVCAMKV